MSAVFTIANFLVSSTGCCGEFHVVFKHFEDLKNLVLNILKEKFRKLMISCLVGSFYIKAL